MKKLIPLGLGIIILTIQFVFRPLVNGQFDDMINTAFSLEPIPPMEETKPEKIIWIEFHRNPNEDFKYQKQDVPCNVPLDSLDFPLDEVEEEEPRRKSSRDGDRWLVFRIDPPSDRFPLHFYEIIYFDLPPPPMDIYCLSGFYFVL